eukprot:11091151-Alexandrium_andersonii.AAC.1
MPISRAAWPLAALLAAERPCGDARMIKRWSSTQKTMALSPGEAELAGIVEGARAQLKVCVSRQWPRTWAWRSN